MFIATRLRHKSRCYFDTLMMSGCIDCAQRGSQVSAAVWVVKTPRNVGSGSSDTVSAQRNGAPCSTAQRDVSPTDGDGKLSRDVTFSRTSSSQESRRCLHVRGVFDVALYSGTCQYGSHSSFGVVLPFSTHFGSGAAVLLHFWSCFSTASWEWCYFLLLFLLLLFGCFPENNFSRFEIYIVRLL